MTAQELIKASLRAIGAIATGETPTDAEMQDGLEALNMMLRYWGTKRTVIHYVSIESFALTGRESYSIGATGNFATVRPVKITGGYTRSGGIDTPFKVVDEKKYRNIAQKSYSGEAIGYIWYNPTWGASELGAIYVYPAVSTGTIYLHCLRPLAEPSGLTETVLFPGEYDEPIKWNLAVRLCPEYGKRVNPDIAALAVSCLDQLIAFNASLQIETVKLEILSMGKRWNINEG